VLLPEAMKEQDYATCFLGKWHLIPRPKPTEKSNPQRVTEIKAMSMKLGPVVTGLPMLLKKACKSLVEFSH
jgi:arylsulfatase A-like enzyme